MRKLALAALLGAALVVGAQTASAQPANDDFANATAIAALPFVEVTNTTDATTEDGEPSPCGAIGATVWYSYAAAADGQVAVTTLGSAYDTVVAVYTGDALDNLTELDCNDDIRFPVILSLLTFDAVAGTTYFIQVGGFQSASGPLTLTVASA